LAFSSLLAGQQPFGKHLTRVRPFTTVDDVLNREAEASDPAGIHQYSEDLLGLVVPDRAGYSTLTPSPSVWRRRSNWFARERES
jgi:hypothetical protein